jgi:hypothetical protein
MRARNDDGRPGLDLETPMGNIGQVGHPSVVAGCQRGSPKREDRARDRDSTELRGRRPLGA